METRSGTEPGRSDQSAGSSLYAAEFFNEPNIPGATSEMPKGYDAKTYGQEFRIFRNWAKQAVPAMKILGAGGVGEGGTMKNIPVNQFGTFIPTEAILKENPDSLDGVSYHFYGSVSDRCKHLRIGTAEKVKALSAEWLDRTLRDFDFYAQLAAKYEPGKPIWNTETAQAACGGSPWAATFLDSFHYLNQNGALVQKGVQVVMHNTLAASDYALLDPETLNPWPNYWAAVLWAKVMGATVLAPPSSPSPQLRLYAHCL